MVGGGGKRGLGWDGMDWGGGGVGVEMKGTGVEGRSWVGNGSWS